MVWVLRVTVYRHDHDNAITCVWEEALRFFESEKEAGHAANERRDEIDDVDADENRYRISITEVVPLSERQVDLNDEEVPSVHFKRF